jgi:nitroreductase
MALCTAKAITVGDLSYERDLFDLADNPVDLAALTAFLASRRSVRAFRPDAVSRDQLEAIARTIGLAPMGFPPPKVEITIITERATIERALVPMVELYERLSRQLDNPIARLMIRRRVGRETWASLDGHLRPMLGYRMADTRAGRYDTITRGAPALLLLHARAGGASLAGDAAIALAYGLLGAHALGLGATALDLVPPAVNRSPSVRRIFGIPAGDDVLAAMIVGHPRVRFRRGIRRAPAAVHWVPAADRARGPTPRC